MNFSKEYIKECASDVVQDLVMEGAKAGDWYCRECAFHETGFVVYLVAEDRDWGVNDEIWLPTGDQLDEEIVKIFKDKTNNNENYLYNYGVSFIDGKVSQWEVYYEDRDYQIGLLKDDIKLAKIKLLKQLLQPSLGNNAEPIEDYPDEDPREVR